MYYVLCKVMYKYISLYGNYNNLSKSVLSLIYGEQQLTNTWSPVISQSGFN